MDVVEAIRFNYLFRGLSKEQTERVANIVEQRRYDGGETMVRQFDRDTDMMIVVTGGAKIKSFSGESLAEVGPGSVVGEVSLIDDQPRSATVVAVGTTVVAVLPGKALADFFQAAKNTMFGLVNLFSGGALERFSIFALGIMPYISASIILQLLTVIWPYLEKLSKEGGEAGRRKITQWTRYGTVVLSVIQSLGIAFWLENFQTSGGPQVVLHPG